MGRKISALPTLQGAYKLIPNNIYKNLVWTLKFKELIIISTHWTNTVYIKMFSVSHAAYEFSIPTLWFFGFFFRLGLKRSCRDKFGSELPMALQVMVHNIALGHFSSVCHFRNSVGFVFCGFAFFF